MPSFRIIVGCLMLVLARPAYIYSQKITFEGGVILGIYGVDIKGDKEGFWDYDYKKSGILGISAGPFVKCNFTPGTYGVLELRYIKKGTTFGYINQYFTQSFETIKFDYIEIPVLIGKRIVDNTDFRKIDFSFETGFAFAKLYSSRLGYMELTRRTNSVSLSGFKNFDVSWVVQIKFPYRIVKKERLMVGLRMERSLVTIHNKYKLYNFDYGVELNYVFK